jgi:hypothetical protein
MKAENYWRAALPTYLKLSFSYALTLSIAPLAIALLAALWTRISAGHWPADQVGIAFALIFGAFFFLLAFVTAVGEDIRRNWATHEPTVSWNPQLVWRNFIYLGAIGFFAAAFLAYHQGAWLSVFFLVFSIASLITARKCF